MLVVNASMAIVDLRKQEIKQKGKTKANPPFGLATFQKKMKEKCEASKRKEIKEKSRSLKPSLVFKAISGGSCKC